ncbi:hypothetical protein PENTCL1PPCAC_23576, partial [Pristionchus entomophagus]
GRSNDVDEAPPSSTQDEPSHIEPPREPRPIPVPTALIETISIRVCPNQRLGFNIRQSDNRVLKVYKDSPLHNKMCVGDKLLKIDGKPFDVKSILKPDTPRSAPNCDLCGSATPHEKPSCSREAVDDGHKPVTMRITVERAVFSWCRLECTTLEKMLIPKGKIEKTIYIGRPIRKYTVVLRRPRLPGIDLAPIGLSLRYGCRERVTVEAVEKGSLAATHLRPDDTIKRVNGEGVLTKTMCACRIWKALRESGQVTLSVEVLDTPMPSRDTEMPEDVIAICAKQIALLKSGVLQQLPPISVVRPVQPAAVATPPPSTPSRAATTPATRPAGKKVKRNITYSKEAPRVEEIASDVPDGKTLKKANCAKEVEKK